MLVNSNPQSLYPLHLTPFLFECQYEGYSLHVVAKRYSLAESNDVAGAYTIILASGIGSSAEVWIPTIRRLYQHQSSPGSTLSIGNIWAVEAPNHGDAAVLNENVLKQNFSEKFTGRHYGDAVRALVSSGMVDTGPRLIAIGHSAGCGAQILSVPEADPIPYSALILIEPALYHVKAWELASQIAVKSSTAIMRRKDVWSTTREAIQWMKARYPWNRWHAEVLQAVSDFGFRPLPTAEHPDDTGVTTKTYKGQEASAFMGFEDYTKSVQILGRFCRTIRVHTILASKKDIVSQDIQDMLVDPADGRTMASVLEIPDTGHFAIQENPDLVSKIIFDILSNLDSNDPIPKARL